MGFCTKVVINQISLQNKTRKVPSNQVSFEQLAVIAGGPLVGKLMDQLPRVPAYSCLSAIQVIHLSNNCGWKLSWNCILFSWHLIYPLWSGSCTVVICWDDNSSPYCSFYSAFICNLASLVCHTSISRGYGEVIRISSGSCNGAWLGSAGTNSSFFLSILFIDRAYLSYVQQLSHSWLKSLRF